MGGGCRDGQYWDGLVQSCIGCQSECKKPHINDQCIGYCESAACKALPGHHYDLLLKTCVRCADVCGRHTSECDEHCPRVTEIPFPSFPPSARPRANTKRLLVQVTSQAADSRGLSVPTALEDSTILLYSLLALCMVLLFSSLSLALAVLLRGPRAKTFKSGPKEVTHHQESVAKLGQEVDQAGKSSKDFLTQPNHLNDREPSYDSSPTETCVCIHCFPDLKAHGQANDRPPRAPLSFYQQPALHRDQIQKKGPLWSDGNQHAYRVEAQEEAAVG